LNITTDTDGNNLWFNNFIGDFQIRFPCRGAAFDPSPAFQRREKRYLDLPVAERRLNGGFVNKESRRHAQSSFIVLSVNRRSATMRDHRAIPGVETPG